MELISKNVIINVEVSDEIILPELVSTSPNHLWNVSLQHLDSTDNKIIHGYLAKNTTTIMYILRDMSSLSKDEFKERFMKLYSEFGMGDKTMLPGLYQRIYRSLFPQERFGRLKRENFEPLHDFK